MPDVELTEDQRRSLEEALRWEGQALVDLGAAELQRQRASLRVDAAADVARNAGAMCANVLRVLCDILQLPPGDWEYDKATGKLVLREAPHA